MKAFLLTLLLVALTGCATTPPVARISATTFPEAVFPKTVQEVRSLLVSTFASNGAILESSTENTLVFRINDPNSAMRKMFFGCVACADPYASLTLVIAPLETQTKVVAQYWYVIPQMNGSQNRMPSDNNNDFNGIQELLWKLSGSDPRLAQ